MQIKIKGAQYGEWGIQRFGRESKKVRHRAAQPCKITIPLLACILTGTSNQMHPPANRGEGYTCLQLPLTVLPETIMRHAYVHLETDSTTLCSRWML